MTNLARLGIVRVRSVIRTRENEHSRVGDEADDFLDFQIPFEKHFHVSFYVPRSVYFKKFAIQFFLYVERVSFEHEFVFAFGFLYEIHESVHEGRRENPSRHDLVIAANVE